MTISQHWHKQENRLRAELQKQSDFQDVLHTVCHALLQTEQNALADIHDDILRQQIGLFFAAVKNALPLVEVQSEACIWAAQSAQANRNKNAKRPWLLWIASLLTALLLGLYCYLRHFVLGWILVLVMITLSVTAICQSARQTKSDLPPNQMKVTRQIDVESLLSQLSSQMRLMDQTVNDLTYLNSQLQASSEGTDSYTLDCISDLYGAFYDYDPQESEEMIEISDRLAAHFGLNILTYTQENSRYFTALPSKNETRTISPAILSHDGQKLLKQGTAAVRMDAA